MRRATRRIGLLLPLVLLLLLVLLGQPPLRAQEAPREILWDLSCETTSISPGDPLGGWLAITGLEPGGRGDSVFAWADDEASLLLLLRGRRGEGERELELELEVIARGRGELFAHLGATELGGRRLEKNWSKLSWSLPVTSPRPGPNVLRLERRGPPPPTRRRGDDRYALKEIRLTPEVECRRAARRAEEVAPHQPLVLSPGQVLVSFGVWSAPARLDLEIRTAWPKTEVAVECFDARSVWRLATVSGGRRLAAVERLDLEGNCAAGAGFALIGLGPDPVRVGRAAIEPRRGPDWRRSIDLAALLITFALGAFVILILRRRARLGGHEPPPVRPWLDLSWVIGLALAARLAFIAFYPYPGHADDSYEYLLRARQLADGSAAFWTDLSWHAWQTYSRPPGYFFFLATTLGSDQASAALAIALQLLFSALVAGATYLAARPLFGRTAALAGGCLFALYLPSITTFSTLMTEPLYMLFLVPALAASAWTATAPRRSTAVAAGALFGLAALVRSGPLVLAPIVGALMLPALGWRKGLKAAVWLVGAAVVTVLPWIVRNSILAGELTGVDDIVVANLLQTHPDPRFVSTAGLDIETAEGWRTYYWRVRLGNEDRLLSRQQGAILRGVLTRMVRDPGRTVRRFRDNVRGLLAPAPDENLRWILGDHHRVRLAWLTAAGNAQYLLVLIAGVMGLALALPKRDAWPLIGWLLASLLVVTLLFYPEPRFRLQTIPCLMIFAGAAIARVVEGKRRTGRGGGGGGE